MKKDWVRPVNWWLHDKCYSEPIIWRKNDDDVKIYVNIDLGLTEPVPIYTVEEYDEWRAKVMKIYNEAK